MKQILTTIWTEISGFGYRKTMINIDREHLYTYHSGSKEAEPSIVIIWNTRKAKKLAGFIAIQKDLRDTLIIVEEYNNLLKELYSMHGESSSYRKMVILKALLKGFVITYAKCFGESEGRGTKLERRDVGLNPRFLMFHDYIINMRHKYIAHAGISDHEEFKIICPLSSIEKHTLIYSSETPLLTEGVQEIADENFTNDCTKTIDSILGSIKKKIEKHQNIVLKEILDSGEQITKLLQANPGKKRIIYNGPVSNNTGVIRAQ